MAIRFWNTPYLAYFRLSGDGEKGKKRVSKRKNKEGLRGRMTREPVRLLQQPSSGIPGAAIASDWLILTVLSTLCRYNPSFIVNQMVSAVWPIFKRYS